VTCGEYEDGALGEISIDVAKEGSSVRGLLSCFAVVFSEALQHGTKLESLVERFLHTRFEPAGQVHGHALIKYATSIPDYVAQLVAVEYLGRKELAKAGPQAMPDEAEKG
jgi:ribonucleoside-diphosphate reductase alpha chain